MRSWLKAYNHLHWFEWSVTDQVANDVFKIAAPLAPLNLHCIQWRQQELSKGHHLDRCNNSKLIGSLGYLLIVSAFGATITIVHGDREGQHRGRSQRQRRRALIHLARQLLRQEITSALRTLAVGGTPALPEVIYRQNFWWELTMHRFCWKWTQ